MSLRVKRVKFMSLRAKHVKFISLRVKCVKIMSLRVKLVNICFMGKTYQSRYVFKSITCEGVFLRVNFCSFYEIY
jgi:hypothetical protein